MKYEVAIGTAAEKESLRTVRIEREADGKLKIQLQSASTEPDVVEIAPNVFSILLNGSAFEASIVPASEDGTLLALCAGREFQCRVRDPRAWRSSAASANALEAEGRQQVAAPMPGKIVRVLVAAGESVEARQGLVVVEAMKMQNEVRSPKSGRVERVFVREGQAIRAGEPLLVIA